MSSKSKQAARDRMAEILLYNNIQNTGPYSGQVGPEDPRAGDNVFYNGPGFHDGYGSRGGPMVGPEDPRAGSARDAAGAAVSPQEGVPDYYGSVRDEAGAAVSPQELDAYQRRRR